MGLKMLNLDPKVRYWQITLVDNSVRPNKSYTALLPERYARGVLKDKMAMAEIQGRVVGDIAHWVITEIVTL